MSEDLKPCPFCGGELGITTSFDHEQGDKWGYASCGECAARGPEVRTQYAREHDAPWHYEAIAAWNTRREFAPVVIHQVDADRIEQLERERDGYLAERNKFERYLQRTHADLELEAAAVEALTAKLAKALEALMPFAKAADGWEPDDGDSDLGARIEHPHYGLERHAEFTFGDLRRARAVLAELEKQ